MKKAVLEEKGLIDAWQYACSAKYALHAVCVIRNRALELLKLKAGNYKDIVNGIKELSEEDMLIFPPGDVFEVNDNKTSISFAIGLCIKDVIQYSRNFFEYLSQVTNVLYLSPRLSEDEVKFSLIKDKLARTNNNEIADWFKSVSEDDRYLFVNDYNNRTKHVCDIGYSIIVNFEDGAMTGETNLFRKKNRVYDKRDIFEVMDECENLLSDKFKDYLHITDKITT